MKTVERADLKALDIGLQGLALLLSYLFSIKSYISVIECKACQMQGRVRCTTTQTAGKTKFISAWTDMFSRKTSFSHQRKTPRKSHQQCLIRFYHAQQRHLAQWEDLQSKPHSNSRGREERTKSFADEAAIQQQRRLREIVRAPLLRSFRRRQRASCCTDLTCDERSGSHRERRRCCTYRPMKSRARLLCNITQGRTGGARKQIPL